MNGVLKIQYGLSVVAVLFASLAFANAQTKHCDQELKYALKEWALKNGAILDPKKYKKRFTYFSNLTFIK